jgi:hypothetical protein
MRFRGETPNPRWYVPFVFLSILWAISIHTVTAFLYCWSRGAPLLELRPAGPALPGLGVRRRPGLHHCVAAGGEAHSRYAIGRKSHRAAGVKIVRITCPSTCSCSSAEIFTILYTGSSHVASLTLPVPRPARALELVPWFWTAISFNVNRRRA